VARILQIFRPRTGGTFSHVGVLAAELASRGHEVAICGPPADDGHDFGVRFYAAEIPRGFSPAAMGATREVAAAYRAHRPDLIHAHGAQAGVVARLARPARPAAPLIHTPHRYAFDDGAGRTARNLGYEGLERALMPLASRVLCVCEAEREIAERIGARGRARVVHNGIEPLRPAPLQPDLARFAAGGPLIVAVSELFARKGVEVLLAAMPAIRSAHPGTRLIVAGEGPDRAAVESARERCGVAGYTMLAGHVEGVAGLLGAADVYVNPALAEAFPYGVLEAMSAGRACVVTDAGGTAEAILDGESGVVVPTADPDRLAAAVVALLADPERARRLGTAARERVSSRFTRKRMIEGTIDVYAEVMAG
jgi:glycogen(starch) synthase